KLALTLSVALREDEDASLTYAKPSTGGIVDPTANQAEGFAHEIDNQTDTAPVPASGTVEDDMIAIVLDQDIYEDPRFASLADDSVVYDHFTLTGTDADIASIDISNDGPGGVGKIVFTLSQDVDELDTVLVTYLPDSGTIRIREDEDGERRAQINSYQLRNQTATPPAVASATLDGTALALVFDRALDEDAGVEASWFTTEADALQVDSASLSGATVSLVVSPSATENAEYKLTYTPPDSGGLSSASGPLAAGFTEPVDNVTDYAPTPTELSTDTQGDEIYLLFDQRLDPGVNVDSSWFNTAPSVEIAVVTYVAVDGEERQLKFELEIATPVREGVAYALTYTAPAVGGLRDDDAPKRVQSFSNPLDNRVDVAPQLESASVNGRVFRLEFDQQLDEDAAPPPSCEVLQLEDPDIDCSDPEEYTWFIVERTDGERIEIESVDIAGDTVVLQLGARVDKGDTLSVGYLPKSYDNDGRNLRDVSTPAHTVDGFTVPGTDYPGIALENVTPARATSVRLNREQANMLRAGFDSDLGGNAGVDPTSFTVTADALAIGVQRVTALGMGLSIRLTSPIPECATVRTEYVPGEPPLVDSDGRPIEAFAFDVENLLAADLGLACAAWDGAAVALTLGAETQLSEQVETAWSLRVGDEFREFSSEAPADGAVRLIPAAPVCLGEDVEFVWARPDPPGAWSWQRRISRTAPCAESAVAERTELRVTFDQALDPTLPVATELTVRGDADITEVISIDGPTLLLRLRSPGIRAGQEVELAYSGTSLTGDGLAVGPFTIAVRDATEPPRFVSGFGVGELIALSFDQPLLPRAVAASRFILAGIDDEPNISQVEIGGSSLYLHLASNLPDEPDLFGVVYLARSSGGLAGLASARVPDSVFVVDNYTETPPRVVAVEVVRRSLDVRFDQRVDGREAQAADFVVHAGRRRLEVTEMEWSRQGVVLTLSDRVTSPDAVRLTYAPRGAGRVRDLSGNELAKFEFWADNVTRAAGSMAEIVEEARLRSGSGGTTFARELVRGVVGSDGIRVTIMPGAGETSVAHGAALLAVDAAKLDEAQVTLRWSRLQEASDVLAHLEQVPPWCWGKDDSGRTTAWWLGESDQHGVPSDRGIAVTTFGAVGAGARGADCVLDLISGEWRFRRPGDTLRSPALILSRESGSGPGSRPWPLAR
ncbi:MAG: SwmB domain-containing protein, partial [Chloroflexi bacterium]|nr:SwmB domain-containing protein [Chloroflexota bacterium]